MVGSAYLLVSHGSRDPRPQIGMEHLAKLVASRLRSGPQVSSNHRGETPLVGTAVLELGPIPLHQQIQQFAEQAIELGYEAIEILPIFLLSGVHVMEDIPAEIEMARQQLPSNIKLILRSYLGQETSLGNLLLNPVETEVTVPATGRIVMSHGSRRSNSHQTVEAIATQLNATVAFWSVPPSLETQVTELVKQGFQQIAVLPYFLFEGSITDAIGQEVERLKQQFPYVRLHLGRSIGATPELADFVLQRIQTSPYDS